MNKLNGRIARENPESKRLPIISKIKIGETAISKNTGKPYPISLDYFKCFEEKYRETFIKSLGEKPNRIPIIFISDDFRDSCNERYELRDQKTGDLFAYGDGKNFMIWNKEAKDYKEYYKVGENADAEMKELCKGANGGK